MISSCFNDRLFVLDYLKNKSKKKQLLITVDGNMGTGKTNLSYAIGEKLIVKVIDLDDFIEFENGKFLNSINYCRLKSRLDQYSKRHLVVCGVLVEKVLSRLGQNSNLKIYCRRLNENTDQWELEGVFDSQDEYNKKLKELNTPLEKEVLEYHSNYRPWEKANIFYDLK